MKQCQSATMEAKVILIVSKSYVKQMQISQERDAGRINNQE